jgi:uncharacterized repeat protein (TIGR03803 family)
MTITKSLISQLSLVLPLLASGFAANVASAQSSDAGSVTFTTLYNFCSQTGCADGDGPGTLIQATDGYLYGTAEGGGTSSGGCCGTIYKISPRGELTTVYNFCVQVSPQNVCADGQSPVGWLVQSTGGDFYGTALAGGAYNLGTIFKITPGGQLTTLHSFCAQIDCPDGSLPAGLVQAANGDLYGTTISGGHQYGTLFKITPQGTLTTIHAFCAQPPECPDGGGPSARLVQAANGDLYGTTGEGGANSASCQFGPCGTIFKITPEGTLTTVYSFCSQTGCADGYYPTGLVEAANGDLYGTTAYGGAGASGTIFKLTPNGTLTTTYNFCSQSDCADGNTPSTGLIQAASGNLFGITNSGTIFKITPNGTLTTLYSFCAQAGCPKLPVGLTQATNGIFYGTTSTGGTGGGPDCPYAAFSGCGTIFAFSTGQAPFIETRPTIGVVGEKTTILGYELTGATSVTFDGIPAIFTVDASTAITTTVPAGATTGKVQVITPRGTLSSNTNFEVVP